VPIVVRPFQQPHPPLWRAAATPEAGAQAAAEGFNIVCNAPAPRVAEIIGAYRRAATGRGPEPALGLSRAIVIGETREAAQAAAQRGWARYAESFHLLWKRHGSAPIQARVTDRFADAEAAGMGFAGTVAEVRDALLAQVRETGCNYLVSRFAFGDLTPEEQLRSARLFAAEVMPALAEQYRKAA
jgi:alkanesulfonate monooxygenase SsuD/methylene tetrahydromethanopterin reductase-like flavin-dependent oxidoreductase (luciferase family)